jgi:acyl-CoA synthetase (NDP forming)/RimJ/RimL family protein N-acetyltransferase
VISTTTPVGYPAQWEADVVLRDGSTCHLRPIRPDDADRLVVFHSRLSEETVYYRYFAPYPRLSDRDLARFTHVDYSDRVALVATVRDEIIGVVRYDRLAPTDAEVAFVIRDDHQGRGLGTIFLEHIAQSARERGVRRFVAEILPDNKRMLEVFQHAGYTPSSEYDEGVVHLEFDIRPTTSSLAVSRAREQRAEGLSVHRLLAPSSVAVVGASRDPLSVGYALLTHLVDGGFTGDVFAVNPLAGDIAGVRSFARLVDIDARVDLALVAVPAASVAAVIEDAGRAGVHGLVVVSAGFGETGPAGWDAQRELVHLARANGMRLVGPNALGLINTDPKVSLNASLSPVVPRPGCLGFFSQSGALGVALLDAVSQRGLGLSSFVSAGNRADISGNDLLQYWEEDPNTDVVMLYLESIGNPRKFSRIARRLGHHKPVIAVKAGRSTQGAPLGHSARTSHLPPEAVEQMFRQSGVIRTDTVAQMFDVAQLLTAQQLPQGNRVLALSNSDAMTLMAADAVASSGLRWVDPPIVFAADASATDFERALAAAADDPAVDAILTMFVPTLHDTGESVAEALVRGAARAPKPVLAVLYAVEGTHRLLKWLSPDGVPSMGTVPTYPAVEVAVRALAATSEYAEWRRTESGAPVDPLGIDVDRGRALVTEWLRESPDGGPLRQEQLSHVLSCYGVRLWPYRITTTADDAAKAAAELGYPVVLKTADSHLRLRSDLGGVYFDITDEQELRHQFGARLADLRRMDYDRLVVQRQAEPGAAVVLESVEDPLFGPVLSFGISGVAYDVLGDRSYGIPPLTDTDVDRLLTDPRAASMLNLDDSGEALDLVSLRDVVARLSRFADDLPEISRLTLRPIVVSRTGVAVLGGDAHLTPPMGRTDPPARRLLG